MHSVATVAYLVTIVIYTRKKFITLAPVWVDVTKVQLIQLPGTRPSVLTLNVAFKKIDKITLGCIFSCVRPFYE